MHKVFAFLAIALLVAGAQSAAIAQVGSTFGDEQQWLKTVLINGQNLNVQHNQTIIQGTATLPDGVKLIVESDADGSVITKESIFLTWTSAVPSAKRTALLLHVVKELYGDGFEQTFLHAKADPNGSSAGMMVNDERTYIAGNYRFTTSRLQIPSDDCVLTVTHR